MGFRPFLLALLLISLLAGCAETLDAEADASAPVVADMTGANAPEAGETAQATSRPTQVPADDAARPAPAARDPVVIRGHLTVPDVLYIEARQCGSTSSLYSAPTRGLAWQDYALPTNMNDWTVRMDVEGYAFTFDGSYWAPGTHPQTVPAGATAVRVCNYASHLPFALHFLPPEHVARLGPGAWSMDGNIAAPPADAVYRGQCSELIFPYVSVVAAATWDVVQLPPETRGQPFLVDGPGAVVQFAGGAPTMPPAAPLGIVPDDAEIAIVCSNSAVNMEFHLRIALGDA